MKKTLLLCFIHGFKVNPIPRQLAELTLIIPLQGGDDTFGDFPQHLSQLVQHVLPKIEVRAIVYPKFETKGDLAECVSRFRDW
jgi:hypothetical protein